MGFQQIRGWVAMLKPYNTMLLKLLWHYPLHEVTCIGYSSACWQIGVALAKGQQPHPPNLAGNHDCHRVCLAGLRSSEDDSVTVVPREVQMQLELGGQLGLELQRDATSHVAT